MDNKKKIRIIGILLISLSVFIFLSLLFFLTSQTTLDSSNQVEHKMGFAGGWISNFLFKNTIGYGSFVLPVLAMLWGIHFLLTNGLVQIKKITLYTIL
ncbi:hypothetical protein B6I21_03835, partial [candidate division KSB1 bacterium 4572_119]